MPWLHFLSAVSVFLAFSLSAAVHSQLGRHIAPGESPGFAWIRDHMNLCLGMVLIGRTLIGVVQLGQARHAGSSLERWLRLSVWAELILLTAVVGIPILQTEKVLPGFQTLYLVVVLAQGVGSLARCGYIRDFGQAASCLRGSRPGIWIFICFLGIGALAAVIDPSWRRLSDHIVLDTVGETVLQAVLPAWIGGAVTLWAGIGLAGGFALSIPQGRRTPGTPACSHRPDLLAFFFVPTVFSALLLAALLHAVAWQAAALNLKAAGLQLFLILGIAGGSVYASIFSCLVQRMPQIRACDPLAVMCLVLGAALVWPLTWLLTVRKRKRESPRLLAAVVCSACLLAGGLVLFGNLFDPWFTAFSYLKDGVVKLLCLVVAGAAVLFFTPRGKPAASRCGPGRRRAAWLIMSAGLFGLGSFWTLDSYPEVKAVLLQYHELMRVDAGLVRVAVEPIGLGHWIHLGQNPVPNKLPDPWPLPWQLRKTHDSLLPKNFNLLVIVVDALRGDAFTSAGYPRATTPFLDHWAMTEAVSFRRAYSQGGGSFAAFPFLAGGRSRFELYGPGLYRRNLYLELARTEKIDQLWVTGRFGPRAVFPPNVPVKILDDDRTVSDRQTPSADEAFGALGRAIDELPAGKRFLCFLHLMDVHNDLWKKEQGVDFGDRPRDIYDNNLSYLDGAFERFLRRLKSKGLYQRTVIAFTADHGEQFWEHGASLHGHTLYEEEIRVPLILLTHSMVKRFENVPVLNSDMAPTLVDLGGYDVDPPYTDFHMGVSLRPLIVNSERMAYLHRTVAGRASFNRRYMWYRNWKWKLIYLAELDVLQLFDVVRDPLERHNLLNEQPSVAAEMEWELLRYIQQVEGRTYRPVMSRRVR